MWTVADEDGLCLLVSPNGVCVLLTVEGGGYTSYPLNANKKRDS